MNRFSPGIAVQVQQVDVGRLSGRGKSAALVVIVLGFITMFLPILSGVLPGNVHRSWSVVQLALELQTRLRLESPIDFLLLLPFGPIYLIMLVALATVLVLPIRKILLWLSGIGLFLLYPFRGLFGGIRLAVFADYTSRNGSGGFITLWVILGIAMLALGAIAWTDRTI